MSELQALWSTLYEGETCRSRNRAFLVKRLCWRTQERRLGGLSDCARARLDELAPASFVRARTPTMSILCTDTKAKPRRHRDPRLPSPGTILTRNYHDTEIRVLTLDDGFEWDGRRFGSLSAVARAVTGQRWNGLLFFSLTTRSRTS